MKKLRESKMSKGGHNDPPTINRPEKPLPQGVKSLPQAMCDYCNKEKTILTKTINEARYLFTDKPLVQEEILEVKITRGHLAIGYQGDMNCLDHTEHVKINYCPMCGEKLN